MVRCCDGSLYTGIATDVPSRIVKHNDGKASKYTRSKLPVELVYSESVSSHGDALRREYSIKQLPVKAKHELLCSSMNGIQTNF